MLVTPEGDSGSFVVEAKPKEMLSVRTEDGKTVVKANSSSLQLLQECPRKSHYLLELNLRKNVQSPATLFGSAIHKALEVFYSAPIQERILPKNYETTMAYLASDDAPDDSLIYRAGSAFVSEAGPLRELPSDDKRSLANGLYILTKYFETYIDDPFVVFSDAQGPMVERKFVFNLYEDEKLRIEYFGQIDVVLKNDRTGMILVADHKTSSVVGPDFFNRLKPNHQYTGYLLAAKRALKVDTDSFLVNCLQVKQRPKTARGTPPHFLRQVTRRDEDDYTEFRQTVRYFVEQYLAGLSSQVWPLGHTNACSAYGGCQFLEVCAAPTVIRKTIIETQFKTQGVK